MVCFVGQLLPRCYLSHKRYERALTVHAWSHSLAQGFTVKVCLVDGQIQWMGGYTNMYDASCTKMLAMLGYSMCVAPSMSAYVSLCASKRNKTNAFWTARELCACVSVLRGQTMLTFNGMP